MRIKRLEIYGFKSFPQRVVLPFPPGISAIVGPNGSGKSNIVDALRWILGEQNPRFLRVREMTDLIFAGENGYRPEFAEVCLVLENEEGDRLPKFADQPEISVMRRLYRDGTSEFFINNRACRLKDIVYLFLDTGAHARGYGIIDQGQVGQFVEQSPRERRRFLEELAGIARYKLKREETERQIARSRENLARVRDILVEVEGRLRELEEQAEKARAFLKLQEEVRDLELTRLNRLFLQAREKRRDREEKLTALREELSRLSAERDRLLPERDERQARLELLREAIEEIEGRLREREALLEKKEEEFRKLLQEEAQLARQLAQLEGQLSGHLERLKALKNRLAEVREEREEAEAEIARKEKEVRERKEANRALFEGKKTLEAEVKALKDELISLRHAERNREQEKKRLEEELARLRAEREKIEAEKEALSRKRAALAEQRDHLAREKEALLREKQALQEEKRNLSASLEETQAEVSAHQEDVRLLRLRAKELSEEIRWLKSLFSERKKSEAIGALEQAKIDVRPLFEVVRLAPEEEHLAELAFPELLEALWIPEEGDREKALSLLTGARLSAYLFFGDDPAEFLRRRVSGLELADRLPLRPAGRVVTEEGHLAEPDGLVHLRGEGTPALLSKRRELEAKEEELARVKGELREKEEALRALEERLAELRDRQKQVSKREKELERALKAVSERLSRLGLEEERLHQKEEFLQEKEQDLASREEGLKKRLSTLDEELRGLRRRLEELSPRLRRLEDELRLREKEIKAALAEVRALELSVSATRERLKRALKEEERLLKEEKRLAQEVERLRQKQRELQERWKRFKEKLTALREELEREKEELSRQREELDRKREEYQRLEGELRGLLARLEELEGEISRRERKIHRLEVDLAELELTLRHLSDQAEERFSATLPLDEEPVSYSLPELEKRLKERKQELSAFGVVNLAAIEELEKVRERHRFLLEQKADLEKALDDLAAAVKQINQTCRERLREALKAANEKLALVFPLLFPGGHAELRFTEADDPLEAGLDLLVRLPGKPIRHLAMLSGGEKALTALAVLCAFYLVKPGPFCVLDEVDAPLDEANTERFNHLLQELVKHSQIILVTHNKRVMEVAHALFGVTMEEKGVSKIVSVKLT